MLLFLSCGPDAQAIPPSHVTIKSASEIPTRKELKFLDGWAAQYITGTTPSLDEIAAQPDVAHQGDPVPDPHSIRENVRIVVHGTAGALAAVVTKLMRIDALWVQVGFVPTEPCDVATVWGVGVGDINFAVEAPAQPTALIRDDQGQVTLGKATISADGPMIGEVIVDSNTLYNNDGGAYFNNGVSLAPTVGAPGIAAIQRPPLPPRGFLQRLITRPSEPTLLRGRAVQAGGIDLRLVRDGVEHPRPVKSVTFYRHLRDGQFVRR